MCVPTGCESLRSGLVRRHEARQAPRAPLRGRAGRACPRARARRRGHGGCGCAGAGRGEGRRRRGATLGTAPRDLCSRRVFVVSHVPGGEQRRARRASVRPRERAPARVLLSPPCAPGPGACLPGGRGRCRGCACRGAAERIEWRAGSAPLVSERREQGLRTC